MESLETTLKETPGGTPKRFLQGLPEKLPETVPGEISNAILEKRNP